LGLHRRGSPATWKRRRFTGMGATIPDFRHGAVNDRFAPAERGGMKRWEPIGSHDHTPFSATLWLFLS
jgi:hypothetical protein